MKQEYGPSRKLSVMKDLDQSHQVGKVFVNLGSDLSLKSIVTGKSLEPVGLLMDFLQIMISH
jgi:hypothetical protein